jgi:hypothetical protein
MERIPIVVSEDEKAYEPLPLGDTLPVSAVPLDDSVDNMLVEGPGGLIATTVIANAATTRSVTLAGAGSPAAPLSAELNISPTGGNRLRVVSSGTYVFGDKLNPVWRKGNSSTAVALTPLYDSLYEGDVLQFSLTGAGAEGTVDLSGFALQTLANAKASYTVLVLATATAAGCQLRFSMAAGAVLYGPTGAIVTPPGYTYAVPQDKLVFLRMASIERQGTTSTIDWVIEEVIGGAPAISAAAGNTISLLGDGLFVPAPAAVSGAVYEHDIYSWSGSQAVAGGTWRNFLTLAGLIKDAGGTAGTTLVSGNMRFPAADGKSQVIFMVRISGTIGGPSGTPREWKLQTRRPDGLTMVASQSCIKIAGTDISNRDATLISYTDTAADPFTTNGVQLGLFNESTQPMTITGVSIRIQRTTSI